MGQRNQYDVHRRISTFTTASSSSPRIFANRAVTEHQYRSSGTCKNKQDVTGKQRQSHLWETTQKLRQSGIGAKDYGNNVNADNNINTKENANYHFSADDRHEIALPKQLVYANGNLSKRSHADTNMPHRSSPLHSGTITPKNHNNSSLSLASSYSQTNSPQSKDTNSSRAPLFETRTSTEMPATPTAPNGPNEPHNIPTTSSPPQPTIPHYRVLRVPPLRLLEDLSSVHHLLSLHSQPATLTAELAALETFCACTWGPSTAQRHLAFARDHLGSPELVDARDVMMAKKMVHGVGCVYRSKGLELFEMCVEALKGEDEVFGRVLESCRGDWMVRFRACEVK